MKIGFLILVHHKPAQVVGLVECLMTLPESIVFIHVDRKSPAVYEQLKANFGGNVRVKFIANRFKVFWGSYGQIKATAELIKEASDFGVDYACLLSGQDMPVKKLSDLGRFVSENRSRQFLVNFRLPDKQWDRGGLERTQLFHLDIEGHPWLSNKLNSVIARTQRFLHLKRRIKYNLYGGSNWFNLSSDALSYIVKYLNSNPGYLKSFRFTRTADEIFVQTILMNSPLKETVVSHDLRYIDWSNGPEYPRILREEDFEKLINAENRFFGRKFDTNVDSEIIKKLRDYVTS